MANGVYGTNIPTQIKNSDIDKYVEIYYSYSETQNSTDINSTNLKKLDAENLRSALADSGDTDTIVEGLYNLKLPMSIFGKKGFYTIYIKPKEISATIFDVSTLKDFSNVRGIVFDTAAMPSELKSNALTNNALVGYRVIYVNDDGTRSSEVRFVTSNNKCKPVANVSTSTSSKSYSYQYNENSSYVFLTLTPSMALSFKSSSTPYIGKASQKVLFVNTMFEPIQIDLEMVENDADRIANLLEGSQLRDLDNGIITTFDTDGNIISQSEVSTLKETATGNPQYEIKENRINNIDSNQTITDKIE